MASHRTFNPGPEMPLGSDPAHVARAKFEQAGYNLGPRETAKDKPHVVFEREPRPSVMVRCPLPNIQNWHAVRECLERELCERYGGFTSYPMTGGWEHEGRIMRERGIVYEVSADEGDDWEDIRNTFLRAGHEIGEVWTRIEIHKFETRCAQTREDAWQREAGEATQRRETE